MALNEEEMHEKKMAVLGVLGRYVKIILWVSVVLIVVGFVSVLRSFQVQESVDHLDTKTDILSQQTNEARVAAVEARDALQRALKEPPKSTMDPVAINNALSAISRIESELCGGPCDERG